MDAGIASYQTFMCKWYVVECLDWGFLLSNYLMPISGKLQAIQLAYYRLHGNVVSTYESGHTRFFYHGRTETIRSCSVESTEWVKMMASDKATVCTCNCKT